MEFVDYGEAMQLLKEQGIRELTEEEGRARLLLEGGDEVVHLHLACSESQSAPHDGADVVTVEKARLAIAVELILHKLHLVQVLLIPVAKWRKVFDAVAFSMAGQEDWQEIDATATVALNTRDPLLCGPGDFHLISALVNALLSDAESADQSLMLTTTAAPVLVEIVPDGAIRLSIGNPVLADEVVEAFGKKAEG